MSGSFILAALLALAPAPLAAHLAQLLQTPAFAHANFGVAVYDLDRHRIVYQQNANHYFLAASTTKLVTEGASLALLGRNYRFTTNVYRTGPVDENGVLHGDIILRASGDPNLSGRLRPDGTLAFENEDHSYDGQVITKAVPGDPLAALASFAQQIAAHGVHAITGRVIVDDSMYGNNSPEAGTGAVVSPIMVNDNIVDVTITPGAAAGDAVTYAVSPQTSYAKFVNKARTCAPGARAGITLLDNDADNAGVETVTLTGCLPARSPAILYAYDVPSPRRFAEMAFTDVLARSGIDITQSKTDERVDPAKLAPLYQDRNIIASHQSPPLTEDVKVTLKVSDNLHAATMPYIFGNGDLAAGFARERRWLQTAHLNPDDVVQNDGLGGQAYIQPQFMVRYLAFLHSQPFFPDVAHALPVLGRDGTLFDIQTGSAAAGKVMAKTGTWSHGDALNGRQLVSAKGLAGYMTTRSGRHYAFCFYVNNFAAPRPNAAHEAGEMLGALATATYLYAN